MTSITTDKPRITAMSIVDLLATKHREDVFVPECKIGASGVGCLRLDGWAIKTSWSNPLVVGYEIKVSVADFRNDDKWLGYLPYCNQFYFVSPPGVINKDEVPEQAGLLWVTKTGSRLYMKKKAPYREVVIPEDIYRYVLFHRINIAGEYGYGNKKAIIEQWLKDSEYDYRAGQAFSKKIAEKIDRDIKNVKIQNDKLKHQNESLEEIKQMIKDMGIEIDSYWLGTEVKRKLEGVRDVVPYDVDKSIRSLAKQLQLSVAILDKHKENTS